MAITILVLLNQPQSTAPVHAQIFEVRTQPGMITSFSKRRKKLMQKRLAMGHKQDDHEQEQGYNLDIR